MDFGDFELNWLGHAGFLIFDKKNETSLYIDPFQISTDHALAPADIILITHSHYDHLSLEDIKKIATPDTIIIGPVDCQSKFQGRINVQDVKIISPGKTMEFYKFGFKVEAVKSYNTNKKFHPVGNEWLGYIVTVDNKRIYHAGDTDPIPEMKLLTNIDIALIPVSGTYVMTAEEAVTAVNKFKPKLAIPMHFGSIIGSLADAEKFKSLCSVPVEILKKE